MYCCSKRMIVHDIVSRDNFFSMPSKLDSVTRYIFSNSLKQHTHTLYAFNRWLANIESCQGSILGIDGDQSFRSTMVGRRVSFSQLVPLVPPRCAVNWPFDQGQSSTIALKCITGVTRHENERMWNDQFPLSISRRWSYQTRFLPQTRESRLNKKDETTRDVKKPILVS